MLFAALLLLFPFSRAEDAAKTADLRVATECSIPSTDASGEATDDSSLSTELPSRPEPKMRDAVEASSREPLVPRPEVLPLEPAKLAFSRPYETRAQKKMWYGLAVAGHSAAGFDAWSTRRAISGHYGTESNPFLRPFAHSWSMYAATQVSPVVMDFLGKRMMVSPHRWVRRMWWLPQSVGTSFSFAAGVHNIGVVP
jgi:hypothetical protein